MRKRRTRQHVIEDLGFNHVERQILYANYTVQRYERNDYGYDGIIPPLMIMEKLIAL